MKRVVVTGLGAITPLGNNVSEFWDNLVKGTCGIKEITKFDTDFDLISGRYVIDAKSIMGIFSLDLSKPIDLNIHAEDNYDEILKVLEPFIVK